MIPIRFGVNSDCLTLVTPEGISASFDALWLYDNAPQHRHPVSGQRYLDPLTLPETVLLSDATLVNETIRLTFAEPALIAEFPLAFLLHCASSARPTFPPPYRSGTDLWQACDSERLHHVRYGSITTENSARFAFLNALIRDGLVFLHEVPTMDAMVLKVAALIGYVRETNYGRCFDVRTEPNANHLASTSLGLSLHTDNPYRDPVPGVQLLHCLAAAGSGGDSLFTDGFAVAQHLREKDPDTFRILTETPVTFAYGDEKNIFRAERRLIETNHRGTITAIHFNNRSLSPLCLPIEQTRPFYTAYRTFARLLNDPAFLLHYRLEPGDLVAFDNTRLLHGRTAFDPGTGLRHLQGCYVDSDGLYSNRLVLAHSR